MGVTLVFDISHWTAGDIVQVLTAITSLTAAIFAGMAKLQGNSNSRDIGALHKTVNGRVDELTEAKAAALVATVAPEKAAELAAQVATHKGEQK